MLKIFYADHDEEDLSFFNDAVEIIASGTNKEIKLHILKNGDKLLENIKDNEEKNSVLFLDINMPLKSGFQLLEEIRNEPFLNLFPVIMYSTSKEELNIDKSKALGANFYVVKPYNFNDLIKMITAFTEVDWENHLADYNNFLYKKI